MNFSPQLLSAARAGKLVILAGAGVSASPPSSLPGWYALNEKIVGALRHRLEGYLDRKDYAKPLADAIAARRKSDVFPPDYQAQLLEERTGETYFQALQALDVTGFNANHEALAALAAHGAIRAIVTTNFDPLIEQACQARGLVPVVAFDRAGYARALRILNGEEEVSGVLILKIHGCVKDSRSMIDTLQQRLLGRDEDLLRCLRLLLESSYWVHTGFSAADLESDPDYLGLVAAAPRSPGLTYVKWPGRPELGAGAQMLMKAYPAPKGAVAVAEIADFLGSLGVELGFAMSPSSIREPEVSTASQVETRLTRWADRLHPAEVVSCLAGLAEANGETLAGFSLLHRFWKDVLPADRSGPAFDRYRMDHGRFGAGYGMLDLVHDWNSERVEESLQNLFRRGVDGDLRGTSWAGLALLWAGRSQLGLSLIAESAAKWRHASEGIVRTDTWLALAEAWYVLGSPELVLESWAEVAEGARRAGDLPRQARVIALTALHLAELDLATFDSFVEVHRRGVLAQASRLHDPSVAAFLQLALGRAAVRRRAPAVAVEALASAGDALKQAGRFPWRVFVVIEQAKALADEFQWDHVQTAMESVGRILERYPVWVPWFEEAKGQIFQMQGRLDDASAAFEEAVAAAEQLGLDQRAQVLRHYLKFP